MSTAINNNQTDMQKLLSQLPSSDGSQYMALIAKILSQLGVEMAHIMSAGTQSMNDQVLISTTMADQAHTTAVNYENQLEKAQQAQAKAHSGFWGVMGEVFGNKWVQIGITICVGLLLCESPVGFAMLAGTVALQASGALNKATTALGSAMGGSPTANLFASLIITGGLTLGSGLVEGAGMIAVTKALPTFFAKEGTSVAENTAAKVAEQEATKEAATSGAYFRFGNATSLVTVNALSATNLVQNILMQCGVSKDKAAMIGAIITAILSIAVVIGASALNSGKTLGELMPKLLKVGSQVAPGVMTGGAQIFNLHAGVTNIEYADALNALAPISGQVAETGTLASFYGKQVETSESALANLVENESDIFKIDFSRAIATVANGLENSA